jgi:hypothetical protein
MTPGVSVDGVVARPVGEAAACCTGGLELPALRPGHRIERKHAVLGGHIHDVATTSGVLSKKPVLSPVWNAHARCNVWTLSLLI